MKVSIITVVYNGVNTIRDCIESVLGQTYPDLEYIVVDGNSTDGTVELVKSYGDRVSQFVSESDKGLYDAMNKGIGMATGAVIGFLNADDLYRHKDVVGHIVQRFAETGVEGVYSDILYVAQNDLSKIKRYWVSGTYKHGDFLWGWMPGHVSFFARKRVYDQYGGFRLDLKSAADYELMLRFIHKHRISLAYLPEITVLMREGGISNASLANRLRANQEDRMAWVMNGLKPYFFTLTLKPLRKIIQLVQRERSVSK